LPKDHITGRNKGHAIVHFQRHRDAKTAVKEMNGFDVHGKKLKVSILSDSVNKNMTNRHEYDLEDDSANQYIHSAQSRALLMQKLSRDSGNN
jgi:RNA recognition motif-containing protein